MAEEEEGSRIQKVNGTEPHDDNNTTTKDPVVKKRPAPDGGWGWLVVLGACIGHLTWGLIVRAFGVTYLILIDEFHASATAAIWKAAFTLTCPLTTGPVASTLCRRFGCRPVCMVGASLVVVGFITTGQAPNIYVIYVTYGLLVGFGLGFIYTPGFIIISQYFDKRKALALSMTSVANGGSSLVFPPLLLFLFREYNFSGMFLILGGVCLHVFIAASLYRPLNPKVTSPKLSSALPNPTKTKSMNCCTPFSVNDKEDNVKEKCLTTLSQNKKPDDIKEKTMKERYSALFKNHAFIALCIVSMSLSSSASTISSLAPAIAVDNGVEKTRAAFLVAVSGISTVTGSLALGHLFDLAAIRRLREYIYAGWFVVLGMGVLLMGVVSTYPAYVTLCVITGIAHGVLNHQLITIIGDIVGKTSDMEGFGVVTFMSVFGGLVSRGITGPIKDFSGCYNMAYLLSGSFCIVAGLVFEAALIRHKRAQRRRQLTHTESEAANN